MRKPTSALLYESHYRLRCDNVDGRTKLPLVRFRGACLGNFKVLANAMAALGLREACLSVSLGTLFRVQAEFAVSLLRKNLAKQRQHPWIG